MSTNAFEKFPHESMNIKNDQLARLKQLFPEVITEGGMIDWEKLKLTLGENIDDGRDRFGLNWAGKPDCFRLIQQPSTGTLVPDRDESINFDETENLFIEGDNLEVIKLLQKSYFGKVKMIYIDPPYNTGNDFVYKDDFKDNLKNYLELTGQVDSEGKRLTTNQESDGRFHSNWLNMMYPRLFLARNLLREDGVIFISIDDNEVHNLRAICNEIFGEENFVAAITVIVKTEGRRYGFFAKTHENLLVFCKNYELLELNEIEVEGKSFAYQDELGGFNLKELRNQNARAFNSNNRPNLRYPFYVDTNSVNSNGLLNISLKETKEFAEVFPIETDGFQSVWRWGRETAQKSIQTDLTARKGTDGVIRIFQKYRKLTETAKTVWSSKNFISIKGTREVQELIGSGIFNFPKPIELISTCVSIGTNRDDIILDFFAGSCTTAHVVSTLNNKDGGARKFICVQLPEPTDENGEAFKAGYKTIADIGKERIRRVIKKIKDEKDKEDPGLFTEDQKPLDLGFKVFKLQQSNFSTWDANVEKSVDALTDQLFRHIDHVSPEAAQEAILFELMLKAGFELTTKIDKLNLAGKTVYSVMENHLLICLEKEVTHDLIQQMALLKPNRAICLDEGFKNNDQLKTNAKLIMQDSGVEKFQTV